MLLHWISVWSRESNIIWRGSTNFNLSCKAKARIQDPYLIFSVVQRCECVEERDSICVFGETPLVFVLQLFAYYVDQGSISPINIQQAAFACSDPKSAKKTVKLSVFFVVLGSACAKAARRTCLWNWHARRSQKHKKTDDMTVFFMLLGSASAKVVRRMLMKSTPDASLLIHGSSLAIGE